MYIPIGRSLLGHKLQIFREEKKLTQEQLAQMADIPASVISRLEAGEQRTAHPKTLHALASVTDLGLSYEQLKSLSLQPDTKSVTDAMNRQEKSLSEAINMFSGDEAGEALDALEKQLHDQVSRTMKEARLTMEQQLELSSSLSLKCPDLPKYIKIAVNYAKDTCVERIILVDDNSIQTWVGMSNKDVADRSFDEYIGTIKTCGVPVTRWWLIKKDDPLLPCLDTAVQWMKEDVSDVILGDHAKVMAHIKEISEQDKHALDRLDSGLFLDFGLFGDGFLTGRLDGKEMKFEKIDPTHPAVLLVKHLEQNKQDYEFKHSVEFVQRFL